MVPNLLLAALCLFQASPAAPTSPTSPTSTGPAGPPADEALDEARRLLAAGETEAALAIAEARVAWAQDDAAAWRLFAQSLTALAATSPNAHFLRLDALRAWERVLALAPSDADAARAAAAVALTVGEPGRAVEFATRALGAAVLAGEEPEPALLALAARARAETLAQLGLGAPAADVLRKTLERAPDASEVFQRLYDLHRAAGTEERLAPWCNAFVERHSDSGVARFYAGYAELLSGDLALLEHRPGDAEAAYGRALARLSQAEVLEPAFAEGVRRTSAQARGGVAWAALAAGDLGRTRALLLAALEAAPDLAEEPDNLGRSVLDLARALGQEQVRLSRFREAADVARVVCAREKAGWAVDGEWWNNFGFLLREYGSQIESGTVVEPDADAQERASEIYRESWHAYERAVELVPEDARIVNDAALMQIYHVRDNLVRAEALEETAIRTGLVQLELLGPDPDDADRFPIAQAIGDAYENLAYLWDHLHGNHAKAAEYLRRSLATDSGDRTPLEEWLAELEAGRDVPEPEPRRVPAPDARPPAVPLVAWDLSLTRAGVRSTNERRPLFVYWRGSGLGLAVPWLDRVLGGPELAELLDDMVCVIADRSRHTFFDRRRDGTPVLCPRYGSVSCGEHVAADEMFRSWWQAAHGAVPGESEEGFYLIPAGADAPGRTPSRVVPETVQPLLIEAAATRRPDVYELVQRLTAPGLPADEQGLAERETRLAHYLWSSTGRAGRERAESMLFNPRTPERVRAALVRALFEQAAAGDPTLAALRDVLPTQTRDGVVAALAARAWPEDTGGSPPDVLLRASQWGLSEARAAATERLAELGGAERFLRALWTVR